jgi:hypothetical protein
MRSRMPALRFAMVSAALLGSCGGVPDITFADGAAQDGALEDGTALDGSEAGCPGSPAQGASACCGAVSCTGDCAPNCSKCATECTASQLCCAHLQNVTCRPLGASCP